MQVPGPVRAARPARWIAEAREILPRLSCGSPVTFESLATRARPLSITVVMPSIVIELSAMFVAKIALRWLAFSTARSCSSGLRSP